MTLIMRPSCLSIAVGCAPGMGERATTGVGIFEMIDRQDANAILDRRRGVRPPPVTVDELKAFMSPDGAPLCMLRK